MFVARLLTRCNPAKTPTNHFSNTLIRASNRDFHHNHQYNLFDETSLRDISSLNSRLSSHIRNGDALSTWDLFLEIHRTRTDFSSYTFTPVLAACSALQNPVCGQQVHALMIKTGTDTEAITKTGLIDMYSKYDLVGDFGKVFRELGCKDIVAWNTMLTCFLRHNLAAQAMQLFEEMRRERVAFSEFSLCLVLKACTLLRAYRQGKQVHSLVTVMGRDLVVLSTALIDFYSNLGYVVEAIKTYDALNWRKDDVIYNALISGCVRNKKYDVAMSIMSVMTPNVIALTSTLAACSENADLWIGKQIHGVAVRLGFMYDTQFCNALLDMYAKCGKISSASFVFHGMSAKDVVSWTSMIDAYGSHGYGIKAVELFKKMGEDRYSVFPNPVTFLAVLSACGHSGLLEQGRECFDLAQKKYNLEPDPEHYACLIDILGRGGQIEEIWCLLHQMVDNDTKPTAAVWAAILNACIINQDTTKGEYAAKHLLQMEPDNPSNYVALSNLYAASGKWDYVDKLRSNMKNRGMAKEEGSSLVTVAGT